MLMRVKNDPNSNLRCAVRFPLHLPVALRANDKLDDGVTQDISAGGVLIHCGSDFPVGSTIEFSISMPAKALGAEQDVRMECTGRVVRCSPVGDRVALGAIIDEYHISR
jgi:PilZ domain